MRKISYTLFIVTVFLSINSVFATDHLNRLGLGISNQLKNDFPALSIKIQKTNSTAFGALFNLSTEEDNGGYGAGLKYYKILFKEPALTFYASSLGAFLSQKNIGEDYTGFQFDFTLGTEFSFVNLQSLGFNIEFGVSLYKLDNFNITTTGDSFLTAGVHFYL